MAHFARIDDGMVREVIVIDNADCGGGDFPESEAIGQAFIASIGLEGEWRQTSYNENFRNNYAGIGYTFDPEMEDQGAFIPPQPFVSWALGEDVNWHPPVPYPTEGFHIWDEDNQAWIPQVESAP
jgi:hypothetical protein